MLRFLRGGIPRTMLITLAALTVAFAALLYLSTESLSTFGAPPDSEGLARIRQSPHFDGKTFRNPVATAPGLEPGSFWDSIRRWVFGREKRVPDRPLPMERPAPEAFASPPPQGLRVTWLGHSTLLIEVDGERILTDPVWGKRCSPSSLVGPARFHPPPLSLDDLPRPDAVIISHDHYDHLERATVRRLAGTGTVFIVPLGVDAHLSSWGVPRSQVRVLDWWESTETGEVSVTATPARHFSGRSPFTRNPTLWASWVIRGPEHRLFFSGDTGMFSGFEEIGKRLGPFDMAFLKIGAYDRNWPDVHLDPEQAVAVHRDLRGGVLMPVHWGTFNLAFHAWNEPPERLVTAAAAEGVRVVVPRPGQTVSWGALPGVEPWWRDPPAEP